MGKKFEDVYSLPIEMRPSEAPTSMPQQGFYVNITNGTGRSFIWDLSTLRFTPRPNARFIKAFIRGTIKWQEGIQGIRYIEINGITYQNNTTFEIPTDVKIEELRVITSGGGYIRGAIYCCLQGEYVLQYEELSNAPFVIANDSKMLMIQCAMANTGILKNIIKVCLGTTTVFESKYGSYKKVFQDNTWERIAKACQTNDEIINTWQIGDTKTLTFNGQTATVTIIGKNQDIYKNGKIAPLTFMLHFDNLTSAWFGNTLTLLNTIYNHLEFSSLIKEVKKQTVTDDGLRTDYQTIFGLSEYEVCGVQNGYAKDESQYNQQYQFFKQPTNHLVNWWTRSVSKLQPHSMGVYISKNNTSNVKQKPTPLNVVVAFCL